MDILTIVLLIIAALFFLGAAVGVKTRFSLIAAGLFVWVLSELIPALV